MGRRQGQGMPAPRSSPAALTHGSPRWCEMGKRCGQAWVWPHSGPPRAAGPGGHRCAHRPAGGPHLPGGRWETSSLPSSCLRGKAQDERNSSMASPPPGKAPPASNPSSPSMRRREKTSLSSESTVVRKGTQVGWMARLLTLPCLGKERNIAAPEPAHPGPCADSQSPNWQPHRHPTQA